MTRHPRFASLTGQGPFSWAIATLRPEFLYPFDEYKLYVNPDVGVPVGEQVVLKEVDLLKVDLRVPSLLMRARPVGSADRSADTHEIVLRRVLFLRIVTIVIAVMAILFMGHLWTVKSIDQLLWQSLGLFASLWGIRGILLKDVSSFPVLVDYVTLGTYLLIGLVIVGRWGVLHPAPTSTRKCHFCYQDIDAKATRCPHCTSTV